MKIDEFKKAIKGLIREEVKRTVAEEINKAMGKVLVEMVKEIKSNNSTSKIVEEKTETSNNSVAEINTKNPKLKSALLETAKHFKPLPKTNTNSLVELMGGGFDKIGQSQEPIATEKPDTNLGFLKQMVGDSIVQSQQSVLDSRSGVEIPEVLKNVFKKDFRSVMKKMDEQKKTGPMGLINSSQILTG